MYIAILCILLVFTLISFKTKKHKLMYSLSMLALTVLLCFRYGQGTDYFGYEYFYNIFSTFDGAIHNYPAVNCEIGYRFICAFFGTLGFDFSAFVFFVSVFQMLMLNRFLKRFSPNKIFSLLLFFPTFYLTYYFSSMRQGLTLALFIGFLIPCIEKARWKRYIVGCLLLSLIHTAALILLVIPIVLKLSLRRVYLISLVGLFFGCILATGVANGLLGAIPVVGSKMLPYLNGTVSIFGTLERLISLAMIAILYETSSKDERITKYMKIYVMGVAIYLFFISFSLISARVIIYFKIFEVILVPLLIAKPSRYRKLIAIFFVVLTVVMSLKNFDAYIDEGGYKEELNAFTYPYVSVFEKEKLDEYRKTYTDMYGQTNG